MTSRQNRHQHSMLQTLWVYRNLILIAFALGVLLWFILINNTAVEVHFPFGLGTIGSTTGMITLLSTFLGAVLGAAGLGVFLAIRRLKGSPDEADVVKGTKPIREDDLPPSDYAAKAPEGLSPRSWSSGPQ